MTLSNPLLMKNMRMIVLSAGGSGRKRTIPAVQNSDIVSIVAIHGRNAKKTQALALEFNIQHWYTDVDRLLSEEQFDFAYVASPPFLHKEQILKLVEARKPILCEKPLCISIEDATEISQAVKGTNIPFRLAHHIRHQRAIKDIKDFLAPGTIGEVRFGLLQWSFNLNAATTAAWKLDPRLGGLHSFYNAGNHAVDLALHLFGTPLQLIASGVSVAGTNAFNSAVVVFEYPSFNIDLASSQDQIPTGNDLTIYGSHGSIHAPGALSETSIKTLELRSKEKVHARQYPPENLYRAEVHDFAEMIGGSQRVDNAGTTLDEAVLCTRILSNISESIERGCRVRI
jgi:1,5-anhydro-D-fructose reductase (1,5-anhydro-D-mannitol-forming)